MTASPKLNLDPCSPVAPRRDPWRAVSDLLGGLLIVAVWLSLWSWVALGVLEPIGRLQHGADRPQAAERLRA